MNFFSFITNDSFDLTNTVTWNVEVCVHVCTHIYSNMYIS